MAPKSSQPSRPTSLGSDQPQPFQAAVTKLCQVIDNAKDKDSVIRANGLVTRLNKFLKEYRTGGKMLDEATICELLVLENDGDNLCSRLDPTVFCTIVELVLQSKPCLEGERVLFLLAQSLFDDAKDSENHAYVESRKKEIGLCLERLLRYFVNDKVDPIMRRWAGILCIHLVQGSQLNVERVEGGPEEIRRNIGRRVVDQADEILRLIYAQLVRDLNKAGITFSNLFPEDFNSKVHEDFPASTQDGLGWGGSFEVYMEKLYVKQVVATPDTIGVLVLANSVDIGMELEFGVPGHTVYIFVNEDDLNFMSLAQSGHFDQILDIQLKSIDSMTIVYNEQSQKAEGLTLQLKSGQDHNCYLDSQLIQLHTISLNFQPGHLELFSQNVIEKCPTLTLPPLEKRGLLKPAGFQERTSHSQVSEVIIVGDPDESQTRKSKASFRRSFVADTQEEDGLEVNLESEGDVHELVDAVALGGQNGSNVLDAATKLSQDQSEVGTQQDTPEERPVVPARIQPRKGPKPKAKPPIGSKTVRSQADTEKSSTSQTKTGGKKTDAQLAGSVTQSQTRAKQAVTSKSSNVTLQVRSSGATKAIRVEPKPAPTTQPPPASQEAKSTQKKSEEAASAKQVSTKTSVNSKAMVTTRSKRSSQVTDEIEDPQMESSKPEPKGIQKTSSKAMTSLSKQVAKKVELQHLSDNSRISTPDEMDASTPKIATAASKTTKTPATSVIKMPIVQSSVPAVSTNQKRKRYSLNPPPKPAPTDESAVFDMPEDDDDGKKLLSKTKSKKSANSEKSGPKSQTSTKADSQGSTKGRKANAKKRQSAPATLDRPAPSRPSTRSAAAKASQLNRDIDKSGDENNEAEEKPAPVEAKTTQNAESSTAAEPNATSNVVDTAAIAADDDANSPQVVIPTGLVIPGDDLYDASPRKPTNKRNSKIDFASRLDHMLGDLSDVLQTQPLTSIVDKVKKSVPSPKQGKAERDEGLNAAKCTKLDNDHKSLSASIAEKPTPAKVREGSDSSSPAQESDKEVQNHVPPSKAEPNGEEIFKKPEIPKRQETPGGPEPLIESNDTPMEIIGELPDPEVNRKRKTELANTTPPKRQRVAESRASEPSPVPHSSSPAIAEPSPKVKKSRKSNDGALPVARRSPRLMERARNAIETQVASEAISAVKDRTRKPNVVMFGAKGAMNQGLSSITKARTDTPSTLKKKVTEEPVEPVNEEVKEKKRKRETLAVASIESPPCKRQSVSPIEGAAMDYCDDGALPVLQGNAPIDFQDSQSVKSSNPKSRRSRRSSTRPSSQTSRVNQDGSPMASSQEDHFGKLQQRLAQESRESSLVKSPVNVRERRLSEVFGPKVVLENKPKGGFHSPEPCRYVAHEKTANGIYQGLATKQVVTSASKLQDPFLEQERKSTGFAERLLGVGSSAAKRAAGKEAGQREVLIEKEKFKAMADEPIFPHHPRVATKISLPTLRAEKVVIRERGRDENQNQRSYVDSLPSMTTGSSVKSSSLRTPLAEKQDVAQMWNVAVRPHYSHLRDAVHRIADEVIIRLSDEEDRMGLIADQYKQQGGAILSNLEVRHANERAIVLEALEQKKTEMVHVYSEARVVIAETTDNLKENSTSLFEREWRKRQDAIMQEIADGRKLSGR